jgi:tetratricopeptide (TPR) repeat protein
MPRERVARGSRLALVAFMAIAALVPLRNASARTLEEWLADGDREYAAARLPEARTAYAAAVQAAPASVEALCRLSKAESELGELQKGDEQKRTRASAAEHARAAIKVAPDSAAGHVWLAVALGRQALSEGPKTKLALSREIKSEVDRAIALDPAIGRAWHVLAMWNVKLSNLNAMERMAANMVLGGVPKGASNENAEIAFRKAIALEPGYVNHHLEYGKLLRSLHRDTDARNELEKAASLPPTSNALDARYQSEARELLGKMKK